MTFQIDKTLHWTDHYVKYGFAIRKGLVGRSFCDQAVEKVRRVVQDDRPLTEWDKHKPGFWSHPYFQDPGRTGWTPQNPVLEKLYDQPCLRAALDELHGGGDAWDGVRNYYIFLNPYDPDAQAMLEPKGHIDFKEPTPILYRGFTLSDRLGRHRAVQRQHDDLSGHARARAENIDERTGPETDLGR